MVFKKLIDSLASSSADKDMSTALQLSKSGGSLTRQKTRTKMNKILCISSRRFSLQWWRDLALTHAGVRSHRQQRLISSF